MFPLRKLEELSPLVRLRKIARILHAEEVRLSLGGQCDAGYLTELIRRLQPAAAGCVAERGRLESAAASLESALAGDPGSAGAPGITAIIRGVNLLRNDILSALGAEPSEWDLLSPDTGALSSAELPRLPIRAYLEDIRSPFNVGSMFRTAEAFGAERMILSPRTPSPDHPRARRTARGAEASLPWEIKELPELADAKDVFALELGGADIGSFPFPASGIVLVGSEELGLSPEALEMADAGRGRVSIPLSGAKRSLNVSVAFGILMQAWSAALRGGSPKPDSGG